MTIAPTPEQEEVLAAALKAGLITRAEDALDIGVETLRSELTARRTKESPEEWIAKWNAFLNSHSRHTPILSDEAMSRESIYEDRGP